jgi:hypothetical protein
MLQQGLLPLHMAVLIPNIPNAIVTALVKLFPDGPCREKSCFFSGVSCTTVVVGLHSTFHFLFLVLQ